MELLMTHTAIYGAGAGAAGDSPVAPPTPPHAQFLGGYVTETECAEELGISRRTLQRWHRLREGPPRTLVGKKIKYRRASVAAWLIEQEREVGE